MMRAKMRQLEATIEEQSEELDRLANLADRLQEGAGGE